MLYCRMVFGMSSDTILLPDVLPYPDIQPLSKVPELDNKFVYVIERYPLDGICVVVCRSQGIVTVRFGDFSGNILDPREDADSDYVRLLSGISQYVSKLTNFLSYIKIDNAAFYIVDGPMLVDVRLSMNKYAGPGYIRDFFGKIIPTQKVIDIYHLDDEKKDNIIHGKHSYTGEYVVKPSAFKTMIRDDQVVPMYGMVIR